MLQAGTVTEAAILDKLKGAAEDPERIGTEYMPVNAVTVNPESAIVVESSGTDTQRGTSLIAAYAAAKALTPNGAVLSATNRATVVLMPGAYKLTSTFILDTNFVDILAQVPSLGGARLATDSDEQGGETPMSNYRPPATVIYSDDSSTPFTTVKQTCADIRIAGIGFAYLGTAGGFSDGGFRCFHIDNVTADSNKASVYRQLYFFHRTASDDLVGSSSDLGREPVWSTLHLDGTWIDCTANAYAWRMGQNGELRAKMRNCVAGAYSWGGDATGASITSCVLENCKAIGLIVGLSGQGVGAFGGCLGVGIDITSAAKFIECDAEGGFSFGSGKTVAGTFLRCRGGEISFGGGQTSGFPGTFSGYAEDCIGGKGSFGGSNAAAVETTSKLSGSLLRCTITGNDRTLNMQGATVIGSRITTVTTGKHCVTITDSNSAISDTDLIVFQGGTGLPVYAASALNAAVYACRMNNASNDADGLGANVTNLVTGGAGNVVSNAVK